MIKHTHMINVNIRKFLNGYLTMFIFRNPNGNLTIISSLKHMDLKVSNLKFLRIYWNFLLTYCQFFHTLFYLVFVNFYYNQLSSTLMLTVATQLLIVFFLKLCRASFHLFYLVIFICYQSNKMLTVYSDVDSF